MTHSFAMPGLAEAAFAETLVLAWLAIGIVGGLIIVGCLKRSLRCILAAIFLSLTVGMLFGPYDTCFGPKQPAEVLRDPDYVHWLSQFRIMSVTWILVTTAAVVLAFVSKFPIGPNSMQSGRSKLKDSPVSL
jgi:hypothetical protein